jgi:hypothetical protein
VNRDELFTILTKLPEAQLETVIQRSEAPSEHFPSSAAAQSLRANALLSWADIAPGNHDRLLQVLRKERILAEPALGPAEAASQPARDLPSRVPIVIAIETVDAPLEERHLLPTERHLTVTLDPEQVSRLEALGGQLTAAGSTDAILAHGVEAWRVLNKAQSRLSSLLDTVAEFQREGQNPQPIAWTGKAAPLCRIFRAILAACRDRKQGVGALVSVGYGAHYFHPLHLSERPPTMARRQSGPGRADIEIERIEIAESDCADADMLPRIAGAIAAEVVLVGARQLERPFLHLAELVGRHEHSATRLAIGFGDVELTPDFLTTVLATLPAVSFAGPGLRKDDYLEDLSNGVPTRLPQQAVPVALSWLRNQILRHAFDSGDVSTCRDALFWISWSWVGRPLFASQFGEVTGACYPHIMDLRSVAKKAWYCPRHEGIPPTYHAEKLAESRGDPERSFHLYLTGAGGTGKSCYLRNVYETLEDNQPSVLPVWYKVDAPSSDWENVDERIKEETVKALDRRLGKEVAERVADPKKFLRYFLTDLMENLRQENAPIKELVLFVDQLERTFESGDNPNQTRLARISKEFISLLAQVGVGKGIRLFIASRKQYLPDFLTSFENAQKRNLHFCVLQSIQHETEQIEFAQTVLRWCKNQQLVPGNLDLDDGACKELAQNVDGHPLKLMLALIRILSLGEDHPIGAADLEEMKPKPWEDLFYIDELLAAKDELDWYFFLAMAHARTEIVSFSEVWWRLRLVSPQLTERADNLGRQGALERLWLLGHLGRTVHPRPLGTDKAGFLEFFHANLRDHLVTTVMNYGGEGRLQGQRRGMPPAWRAVDRLTAAARDWKQSQQLMLREDVQVLMEQKEVFIESIHVGKKTQIEAFYLLFMRDAEENRDELFDCARECFVYSALVHDVLGRWAFKQLFRNVPEQVKLCQKWLQRSDRDSRIKILQYLVELRSGEATAALCELVFRPAGSSLSDMWQQLANILAEPLFARRYRSTIMVAALKHLLRSGIDFPDASWQTTRFGEFCTAACNSGRDELLGLIKQMADDVTSLQDAELHAAVTRLLAGEERIEKWLQDSDAAGIDLAVTSREIHGYVPPRIELRLGNGLTEAMSEELVEHWHRRITEELGLPLPAMVLSSGEVTGERTDDSGLRDNDDFESANRDGDDRPAYKLSLLIDGRVVGVGDFYPGQVQTLRRHWTLAGRTPPESNQRSHNEALRECVVWLPQNELDDQEWKGELTPFEEAVRGWLAELLRQSVAEVFTLQELMPLISTVLNQRDPRLNVQDFLRTVSGNELALWQVLVNLARERVPLHGRLIDLMVELQEVVTQTGQTNTVLLTQRLREHVRHALCRAFADQTNQLPVMLFGEATESTLIERLGVNRGQPAFALKSEEAVELAAAISGQFATVVQTEDSTPVLVCEEELRSPLFRMIQHFDPRLHVLSYTELSEDVQPRSCGVISGLSFEASQ